MRIGKRIVGLVVFCGIIAAVPGIARAAAALAVSPQALVLKQNEVPSGFKVGQAKSVGDSELAKALGVSVSVVRSKGFSAEYEKLWQKTTNLNGVIVLGSTASVWKSASGASWFLTNGLATFRNSTYYKAQTVSVKKIGDETGAFTFTRTISGKAVTYDYLEFRRGGIIGIIIVGGLKGQVKIQDAIPYAGILDARIKQVH